MASALLLVWGLVLDFIFGKAWVDNHPFMASLAHDLFPLVAIGTLGVLVLNDLRAWSIAWRELRALAPKVGGEASRFIHGLAKELGLGARAELEGGPDLDSALRSANMLAEPLGRVSTRLYELNYSLIRGEALPTVDLRMIWIEATAALEEPPDRVSPDFVKVAEKLRDDLATLSKFTSAGTSEEIAELSVKVEESQRVVAVAQQSLRSLLIESTPNERAIPENLGPLTKCWGMVGLLAIVLERTKHESELGEPYPGRS